MRRPICLIDQERCQKMGRVCGIYEGGKPTLMVTDPDLLKQILVKEFPSLPNRRDHQIEDPLLTNIMTLAPVERWRKIRQLSTPAFSTAKLRKMNDLIQDCARVSAKHLADAAEEEKDVDVKQFYGHFALDMIARCAFGTTLDSYTDATNEFVTQARIAFAANITPLQVITVLLANFVKRIKPKTFNEKAFLYFKSICQRIMTQRAKNNQRKEDFLQLMIEAREGRLSQCGDSTDEPGSCFTDDGAEAKLNGTTNAKVLTEDEALAQCVLFFVGGQETTASMVAFAAHLLAVHPDVQDKLRREVDECIATHGSEPSMDAVARLKYLHCIVSETLRLYPTAPRLERSAVEDCVLGETGIKIRKGGMVTVPLYALHRDPEFFPEPDAFKPERFSEENADSIKPYTYLPFGAGPRNCIGMRLGLHAIKVALLHSVHKVQFVRTEKTQVPLKMATVFGAVTAEDMTVGIRKRTPLVA
ncbi:cytochrome P450 3A24 isoform X1 [Rhipicephalus sanguineus]|uniref:cytochrome P450 3A24 isoform X1 n=1 Tax=Rhipicephalus sanguineus TaxID=34632 RepID=UPI0020C52FFA|nr:cytochrome P450 3A24 isoform X1 [Rhipicephalus sanguineus]